MKKLYFLLSAVLGLTACNTEDLLPVDRAVAPGSAEANVTFTLEVPENDVFASTRSALFGAKSNSANGGLTNVNFDNYDLRYKLAIYRVDGPTSTVVAVAPITKTFDAYQGTSYALSLTPNRDYKVVVWADFVNEDSKDDLHYNTTDFENITVADPAAVAILNDESRDAYRVVEDFHLADAPLAKNLVLTRPFAKVRFVATDWGLGSLEKPTNIKVTYYGCERFSGLNLVTGETTATTLAAKDDASLAVYTGTINRDNKEYALGYDGDAPTNRTLFVDYLMTKNQTETPIHLTIEALDDTKALAKHDVQTNVPIKTNWLTTILGRALTKEATFTVSVEEYFVNNWIESERWWKEQGFNTSEPKFDTATNTYSIGSAQEFAWLSDHSGEITGKTVVLTNDIDMSGVEWKPFNADITFDGQGHKLRNFSINGKHAATYTVGGIPIVGSLKFRAWSAVFAYFNGTMRNVTFENITINGMALSESSPNPASEAQPNSKVDAYFAGCIGMAGRTPGTNNNRPVVFENVHSKHVHIKAGRPGFLKLSPAYTQNLGGLVGWVSSGSGTRFTNCSANDIHLQCNGVLIVRGRATDGQVGGLIGHLLGGEALFDNCRTSNVTLRVQDNPPIWTSAFIGRVDNADHITINNCPTPTNVAFVNHDTGKPFDYKPANVYFGAILAGNPTITPPAPTAAP